MMKTLLIALGFVFFWNSGFIGAEFALPATDPFTLLFWRYWALVVALGLYLGLTKKLEWIGWPEALRVGVVGILAHGVWLGCVLFSLDLAVPAGIVALVVALQPMATGAFSGLVTGESTPVLRWIGLLTGFFGVSVAVLARVDFSDSESVFAYLIPFGSVIAITAASLHQRRWNLKAERATQPLALTLFHQSLGTALAVSLPAIFAEGLATEWSFPFVATMLWLIFAVSLLAYGLMWVLLARIDATRVASLFYLGPPVTMVMAWVAFGDRLIGTDLLGLVVVLVGVGLSQGSLRTKNVAA